MEAVFGCERTCFSQPRRQSALSTLPAGCAGTIAAQTAARATPDGYTFGTVIAAHAVNASLNPKLPYDVQRDFTPVASVTYVALALVVKLGAAALTRPVPESAEPAAMFRP